MKAPSDYLPIDEYAVIGDCRTAALVSREGAIEWLCLPHFSAPAVFAAILDRRIGGRFAVHPADAAKATRRYVGDTNVLETTFTSRDGVVRLTDCMPVLPGPEWDGTLQPQREVLRMLECQSGSMELEVICEPRPDFARPRAPLRRHGTGTWTCAFRDQQLMLHTDIGLEAGADAESVRGRVRLNAGDKRYLSLTYVRRDVGVIAPLGEHARQRVAATLRWWREWSGQCTYEGPYREYLIRSLLVLKLMTFQLSGAVVAAPTASLPEKIGGVRNWDYRYCWLRDAALTFRAFSDMGYKAEANAFIDWLLNTTRLTWPELQVMYDVYGESRLREYELDHLEGYKGSRPVRIGNAAYSQLQLDTYGAVVEAVYGFIKRGGLLDAYERRRLVELGRCVCRQWELPDKGIWEVRGDGRHNTHSKLMCWVALDRLLRLHEDGELKVPAAEFRRERGRIAESIEQQGYNAELGSYTGAFGYTYMEAGLLLMARYGFKDPADPRMHATYLRLLEELCEDGLIYRHRNGLDGLPPGEGAFVISSFWLVDYQARLGRLDEALHRFESLLGYANDVGLFAEEIDPADGAALGNFPQAYSHVGLITAALALEEARRQGRRRA